MVVYAIWSGERKGSTDLPTTGSWAVGGRITRTDFQDSSETRDQVPNDSYVRNVTTSFAPLRLYPDELNNREMTFFTGADFWVKDMYVVTVGKFMGVIRF